MRISKTKVLDFLMTCQINIGGYSGNDIAKLAKNIPVSSQALRKRINYWTSTDPAFNQLTYQGATNDFHYSGRLHFNRPTTQREAFRKDVRHSSRDK